MAGTLERVKSRFGAAFDRTIGEAPHGPSVLVGTTNKVAATKIENVGFM
jgi:hypothetical protein